MGRYVGQSCYGLGKPRSHVIVWSRVKVYLPWLLTLPKYIMYHDYVNVIVHLSILLTYWQMVTKITFVGFQFLDHLICKAPQSQLTLYNGFLLQFQLRWKLDEAAWRALPNESTIFNSINYSKTWSLPCLTDFMVVGRLIVLLFVV